MDEKEASELTWQQYHLRNGSYMNDLFAFQNKLTTECKFHGLFQRKFEHHTVMVTPIVNLETFECYFVFENQDIKLFQIHVGADDTYADVKRQLLKAAKLSSNQFDVDMF